MGRIIEGYWICPYCNSRNKGSHKNCISCGSPRGNEVRFKLDNNCNYVEKEQEQNINKNPDWLCDHCDTLNSDNTDICTNCGNPRNHEDLSYFENIDKMKNMEELRNHDKTINEYNQKYASQKNNNNLKFNQKNHKYSFNKLFKFLGPILGILGSIALLTFFIFLLIPKPKEIIVNSFEWNVDIKIEEYKEVEKEGWSLPPGATLRYKQEEFYGTEQVLSHYETIPVTKTREVFSHYETVSVTKTREVLSHYEEYVTGYRDLGNGYFEEQTSSRPVYTTETYTEYEDRPVYTTEIYTEYEQKPIYKTVDIYKTKYYYNIFEWVYLETKTNSGDNKNIILPEYTLKENERDNIPNYTYYVNATIIDKKENYDEKLTTNKEIWEQLIEGKKTKVKINFGHITEIINNSQN